ncbi:hypothetical protein ACPF04_01145 [Campylobacter sp. MOP51]|uniref:hypothetical protein n=1 Tax=Campylobacter canis TaxID=3378588 RepID=UPI003C3D39AF
MNKILLCTSSFLQSITLQDYSKIYLIDSASVNKNSSEIEHIKLYKYFMRAHLTARKINKILLNDFKFHPKLHLSLIKLSDIYFYESCRMIELVSDLRLAHPTSEFLVASEYSEEIQLFSNLLCIDISNIKFKKITNSKFLNFSCIKIFIKVIILTVNSFFIAKRNEKKIYCLYNDKISFEFAKPYLSKDMITYPFFSNGFYKINIKYKQTKYFFKKFISIYQLLSGLKRYFNNKNTIFKSNLPIQIKRIYISVLWQLEVDAMMILSLRSKFPNLSSLIGSFDTYCSIDYVTWLLNNKYNIYTICIPHGINYRYKVNYISYGTNIYTFWSQDHLCRMENSIIDLDYETEKIITGNVVYKNLIDCLYEKKLDCVRSEKKILVIGEYFPDDNFYSSPFNSEVTVRFFEVLKEFLRSHDCSLTIRTRLNDEYFEIASRYISEKINISSPSVSVKDDIFSHDLIISVFSNALHEALLLQKKVLQVNFLGIENYRTLASDNLVFYAENESDLKKILKKWYHECLEPIDYNWHLVKYANNGKFIPLEIKDFT